MIISGRTISTPSIGPCILLASFGAQPLDRLRCCRPGGGWCLLHPVVHAAPRLLGHGLFERNAQVGDARLLRKNFSPPWFIAVDHVLTHEAVVAGLRCLASRV